MTTKPSSLRPGAPTTTLFDAISNPIPLGQQIGRGGEGSVYEVENEPSLVAKVYHKTPLADDQVAKLQSLAAIWSNPLEVISAWPRSILFDPVKRKPCGLLMTKMESARSLHELYGTTNRRRHFPDVGWHHLVLAARNTAAAFQTMHASGIVVGDVNQGNLLVDKQMCVRMIDCDSFQITSGGRTFNCPVGTPHFTPPELQSQRLRDVVRTANHDRFGMAVLMFHLLFVGRHPFAGRFRGQGDLSIEKAIAERRFAFSKNRAATLVDPPPASLLLEDLPPGLGDLFEAAFRWGESSTQSRPSPLAWIEQLELLLKCRKVCDFDPMHVYWKELRKCPWCRIEDAGGPSFFGSSGGTTIISTSRLAKFDEKIGRLKEAQFPALSASRVALPKLIPLKRMKTPPPRTALDYGAMALVAGCALSLAGAFVSWPWYPAVLIAGAAASLASGGYLIFGQKSRGVRKSVANYLAWLGKAQGGVWQRSQQIALQHQQREEAFRRSKDELNEDLRNYRAEGAQLRRAIVQQGDVQKNEYLRGFLIRDCYKQIPGLTTSHVTLLESFGVESAYDVEQLKLYGIPSIDAEMTMELLQWRAQVERGFVFDTEHSQTLAAMRVDEEAAARRFKVTLARKILMGADRLDVLVDTRKAELARVLAQYDDVAGQWTAVAKQLAEVQNGRRPLERLLNRGPVVTTTVAVGVPVLAYLLHLLYIMG
jgi:DNA-binding helix-hairpin-helix protein with protein kinase domain